MGVRPPGSEIPPTRVTPARDGAVKPDTEMRSKFEESMRRKREPEAQAGELAWGESLMPFEQPVLQRQPGLAGDDRNLGDFLQGSATPAPAPVTPTTADGMAATGSPAEIAHNHYAFQDRINLPNQISGRETQLTLTDQRWLVSHATVRSDPDGGLSVEVQTRSDRDSDQRHREVLRSRLEARGHRVASVEINR